MKGKEVIVRSLGARGVLLRLVELFSNVINILFATSDHVDLLLETLNWDIKAFSDTIRGFTSSLLDKECEWADFVKE